MININSLATVSMMVGLPGCGKTTFAASFVKQVLKHNKKHPNKKINVYSNVPIKGAYSYSWGEDFGNFDMTGIIILDEAGLDVDNRNWEKNFNKTKVQFLKLLRHYSNSKLIVFSQTWNDCDVKIRSMTGLLYIIRKSLILGCSVAIPVFRKIDVDEETHEFKEIYYKDFPLLRLFSTKRIIRRFYYNMFDSWDCPELPKKDFDIY